MDYAIRKFSCEGRQDHAGAGTSLKNAMSIWEKLANRLNDKLVAIPQLEMIVACCLKGLKYIFVEAAVFISDFRCQARKFSDVFGRPIAYSAFERWLGMRLTA